MPNNLAHIFSSLHDRRMGQSAAVCDYGLRLRTEVWLTVRGMADDESGGERHGDVGLAELGVLTVID